MAKHKWDMQGGNSLYVDDILLIYIKIIYQYLETQTQKAKKKGKKKPSYSIADLSRKLEIDKRTVKNACERMAFKKKQWFRIKAIAYGTRNGGKITHKVSLVRTHQGKI